MLHSDPRLMVVALSIFKRFKRDITTSALQISTMALENGTEEASIILVFLVP